MSEFMPAFSGTLQRLGGVPQAMVVDRDTSIVVPRSRPARLHPEVAGLFGAFQLRPIILGARRPESKSQGERTIGYLETSFLPLRSFDSIEDLQVQHDQWTFEVAFGRHHRRVGHKVGDAWRVEQGFLAPLPDPLPDVDRRLEVRVTKDGFCRVGDVDYSVPPGFSGRRLRVRVSTTAVVVFSDGDQIARHRRSYVPADVVLDAAHARQLRLARDARQRLRDRPSAPRTQPGSLRRTRRDGQMSSATDVAYLTRALKMPRARQVASSLADTARDEGWDYPEYLAKVIAEEVASRETHGGENGVKAARFPQTETLDDFDFTHQRSVSRQQIAHLHQLDFIREAHNVVFLGPPGTGKTHLSIALGVQAARCGYRVAFASVTDWVMRLGEANRAGRLADELERLGHIPLLIVDEVGYIPFDPDAASLFFQLVSSRCEQSSLIASSNKSFSAWAGIFGDAVAVEAMVDRLIHHSHVHVLKGDSYRLKDKQQEVTATTQST